MADSGYQCPVNRKVFLPYIAEDELCRNFVLDKLTQILEDLHFEYIIEVRDFLPGSPTLEQRLYFVEQCPFIIMPLCKSIIEQLLRFIDKPKYIHKIMCIKIDDCIIPESVRSFSITDYSDTKSRMCMPGKIKKAIEAALSGRLHETANTDLTKDRQPPGVSTNKIVKYVNMENPESKTRQGIQVASSVILVPAGKPLK